MQGKADRHETDRRDTGNTSCQPIKSIQPVDGIGDADKPDHCGQQADDIWKDQCISAAGQPGEVNRTDLNPLRPDHDRHSHLTSQSRPGGE